MPESELEYMKYCTGNAKTFVANDIVACVYCRKIYKAHHLPSTHNCLICYSCNVDAVMIVKNSPLRDLSEPERIALLEKWHADGFTPIDNN